MDDVNYAAENLGVDEQLATEGTHHNTIEDGVGDPPVIEGEYLVDEDGGEPVIELPEIAEPAA